MTRNLRSGVFNQNPPSVSYLNVEPIALKPELTLTQVAEIQVQTETKK